MNLRFRVLSPGNSGAPDYLICGQAAAVLNNVNLGIVLKVDDTIVWNTADVSTYVFPAPIVSGAGYTVTSIGIQNADYYTLNIDIPKVWMKSKVEIIVSKAGYILYQNIFQVFGYDLGNNPNVLYGDGTPVDDNPDMDIRLINETNNVVSGEQTRAYSSFTGYYQPYTNALYLYKLDSSGGSVSYLDADGVTLANTRNTVICSSNISVKQTTILYEEGCCGGPSTPIDSCVGGLTSFLKKTDIPTQNLTATCETCVGDCITNVNTTNIYPALDFGNLETYWVNDNNSYAFDSLELTYSVYNNDGTLVGTQIINLTGITPVYVFDPIANAYGLVNPTIGDYIVRFTLSEVYVVTGGGEIRPFTCNFNLPVHVCNWWEVKKQQCNIYRAYNNSFATRSIVISKLNTTSEFVEHLVVEINSGEYKDITLSDGIYTFTITDGETIQTFIVIVYCALQECILKALDKIICCKCKADCQDTCKAYYDFNSMMLTAHTFFSMLNEEYNFNFIYEALLPNKLADLYEIQMVLDRMNEYCRACNKPCSGCGDGVKTSSSSGCTGCK